MQIKLTKENEEAISALVLVTERTRSVEVNIAVRHYLGARKVEVEQGFALLKKAKKR